MSWGRDFEELGDKLEELAEKFERQRDQRQAQNPADNFKFVVEEGKFDPKNRIGAGISKAMREDVVPDARRNATPRSEARSIRHSSSGWNRHQLYSTSDLIKYHEFGTSTRASDQSQATINAPSGDGYVIPLEGYDSLPFGPDTLPNELEFQFVVHPGVEGKHFMRNALNRNLYSIEDAVAEELDKVNLDL